MDDLEALELVGQAVGFDPEGAQVGAVDFVLAFHLLDHELGVGDDAEGRVAVFQGPGEGGDEAGVFGDIVGFLTDVFAEASEDAAAGVFDDSAVAGWAGVAAGAAVAVGDEEAGGAGTRLKKRGIHLKQFKGWWRAGICFLCYGESANFQEKRIGKRSVLRFYASIC